MPESNSSERVGMSSTKYFDKPRGVLPRANGHSESKNVYRFGPRNLVETINAKYSHYIGGILKKAVLNPGVRVTEYCEENGYEYETYAVYDPKENTITSNYYGCPSRCNHHIGSTCSVCGLKD